MSPVNNRTIPQSSTTDSVFDFICRYKTANDGLSPSGLEIARALDVSEGTINYHLKELQIQRRIVKDGRRMIQVIGGRWILDNGDVTAERQPLAALPAQSALPLPDETGPIPDNPADMRAMIQRLRMALETTRGDNEILTRENHKLKSKARGTVALQADLDRERLDNARMHADLTTTYATALKWQNEAKKLSELVAKLNRELNDLANDADREVAYWKARARNSAHLLVQTRQKLITARRARNLAQLAIQAQRLTSLPALTIQRPALMITAGESTNDPGRAAERATAAR